MLSGHLYTLTVERKAAYYVITLYIPSFLITSLCLIGLFSPSTAHFERSEKCSMGSNTLLNMTVILLIVSSLMPKSATQFPLLGWYIVVEMAVAGVATVISTGILYLHTIGHLGVNVPNWLKYMVFIDVRDLCSKGGKKKLPVLSTTSSGSTDCSYGSRHVIFESECHIP